MEHVPTTESDIEKVYRIAKELGIGIEEAAITCDAFELAFSDEGLRRSIFGMIDELDESAAKKGEPFGLIITYAVELGMDGIRVGRYADVIPEGETVELTPSDRARILLRIKDNFPTDEVLGPMILNRPGWHFDTFDPDAEIVEDISHPEPARQPICLGPIRLTFNDRFSFLPAAASHSHRSTGAASCLSLSGHDSPPFAHGLPGAFASHSGQFASGLSPPPGRRRM